MIIHLTVRISWKSPIVTFFILLLHYCALLMVHCWLFPIKRLIPFNWFNFIPSWTLGVETLSSRIFYLLSCSKKFILVGVCSFCCENTPLKYFCLINMKHVNLNNFFNNYLICVIIKKSQQKVCLVTGLNIKLYRNYQ